MNLEHIPIIDNHAHLLSQPLSIPREPDFVRRFTESNDTEIRDKHAVNTMYFISSVRMLSEFLDCPCTVEAVLEARGSRPYSSYVKELFCDANITKVLCDYGYDVKDGCSFESLKNTLPCDVRPILRIERLAEELMEKLGTLSEISEKFSRTISQAEKSGHVALKTIIAYRTGLKTTRHSTGEITRAYDKTMKQAEGGNIRLCSAALNDHFLRLALEANSDINLPIQFHVGYGDNDIDLGKSNPLDLRDTITQYKFPIVILHAGWPYTRESSYLASVYGNVWIDLSLSVPHLTSGIPSLLSEILGIVPYTKILFGTDASYLPEFYWLAAKSIRFELGTVLDNLISRKYLGTQTALAIAGHILHKNAMTLYKL